MPLIQDDWEIYAKDPTELSKATDVRRLFVDYDRPFDDNDIGSMDVRNPSHTIDNDFFYIKGRPPQMAAHLHALHHTARQAVGACATPRRPRWATYMWNSKRSKRLIDYGDAGVLSSKAGFRLVEAPSAAAP